MAGRKPWAAGPYLPLTSAAADVRRFFPCPIHVKRDVNMGAPAPTAAVAPGLPGRRWYSRAVSFTGAISLSAQPIDLGPMPLNRLRVREQIEDTVAAAEREPRDSEVVAGVGLRQSSGIHELRHGPFKNWECFVESTRLHESKGVVVQRGAASVVVRARRTHRVWHFGCDRGGFGQREC